MQDDVEELKKRLQALESKPAPVIEGGKLDMNELYNIFAMKTPPESTIDRIKALEEKAADLLARQDNTDRIVSSHEQSLCDLRPKVENNHEQRIKALEDALKEIRDGMANAGDGGEVDTAAIMLKINQLNVEVNKKIDVLVVNQQMDSNYAKLKDLLDAMSIQMQKNQDKHNADNDQLRAEFEHHKNKDFGALADRVTALEKRLNGLTTIVNNLKAGSGEQSTGGVDEARFAALVERVDKLEAELAALKDMFSQWQKNFQDDLNTKADKTALADLENTIMMRLNDIVAALTKQFADKAETKKALKLLERQVKNLYDLFMSQGKGNNADEAMFSKKPLQDLSCASCEKGLVDLYGKRVDFTPWSKLPFRDPSERIARVGQGFSKMLSMINPE